MSVARTTCKNPFSIFRFLAVFCQSRLHAVIRRTDEVCQADLLRRQNTPEQQQRTLDLPSDGIFRNTLPAGDLGIREIVEEVEQQPASAGCTELRQGTVESCLSFLPEEGFFCRQASRACDSIDRVAGRAAKVIGRALFNVKSMAADAVLIVPILLPFQFFVVFCKEFPDFRGQRNSGIVVVIRIDLR